MTTDKQLDFLIGRIEYLESRQAIQSLIYQYAAFVRNDVPEQIADLFTSDGVFEVGNGTCGSRVHAVRVRIEGSEAIGDFLAATKGKPHPVPLVHNLVVQIDGEAAEANCVMEGRVCGADQHVIGEYHDRFVRVEGKWLFSSRRYTIFSEMSAF